MFRRHNSGKGDGLLPGGSGSAGLPVTSRGGNSSFFRSRNPNTSLLSVLSRVFDRNGGSGGVDGSAASINIRPSLAQQWERASLATKITWVIFISTILMTYFGYRYIRYYNAGIVLDCATNKCSLKIVHVGFKKPTLLEVGRHQITKTEPVRVTKDGTYVSGNADMRVDYSKVGSKGVDGLNYKGPDAYGHYLSYAIYLRDKSSASPQHSSPVEEIVDQEFDLSALRPLVSVEDDGEYRLVVRQFVPQLGHSKRRVRIMTQKIESFIKRRRQKMLLRETSGPAWQGVVAVVVGIVGFILTLLLGQFQDEASVYHSGPGVRRRTSNLPNSNGSRINTPQGKVDNVVRSQQIPSQYEVSTTPTKPNSSLGSRASGYQTNQTSAANRKRSS